MLCKKRTLPLFLKKIFYGRRCLILILGILVLQVDLINLVPSGTVFSANSLEHESFIDSFIRYYDISTVGRYTHEYHPFLFEKSSYSLDELEEKIVEDGLKIKGRIVLTGYEEQAIPSYYTNYKVCTGSKINDEVRVRDSSGWTQQLHNKFGVMTGFLFRDVDVVNAYHDQRGIKGGLFDHINIESMPIYNPRSHIFQRHAFGDILSTMIDKQNILNRTMLRSEEKGVFRNLIDFWEKIYEYELRFGSKNVLGTQDILFSIAHARHLLRSKIPLFKYYVGPDITYPIKVTPLQKRAATYNAQTFVKKFEKHLKPIDGEATVYIFCSFVDGVGKSTLLGNAKNYKKYGENYEAYDRVDNSSSQLAELYCYDKNVFIADLPAQMSHFTYKPDGFVYFDVLATENGQELLGRLSKVVLKNKEKFIEDYKGLLDRLCQGDIKKYNSFMEGDTLSGGVDFSEQFAKNVLLLKKEKKNKWIPFFYEGENYLFHESNPDKIRKLVELEFADSLGLKNYEAEQMLFTKGVRFPYTYDFFVDDLLEKFRDEGIKNVVFVNFLSMYPRSSRENIRVNYVLQQLALLYEDFVAENSLYGSFVSDSHLLYKLGHDYGSISRAFGQEALVRLSLYNLMNNSDLRTVKAIPVDEVTNFLKKEIDDISVCETSQGESFVSKIASLVSEKVTKEKKLLQLVHGDSKNFVNVQELNFDEVILFGKRLQEIFTLQVKNDRLKKLWREPGEICGNFDDIEGEVNEVIKLPDGTVVEILFVISPDCKEEGLLKPVVRAIRASWYAAIGNLVGGESTGSTFLGKSGERLKTIEVEKERYFVPPIWVRKVGRDPYSEKIVIFRNVFEGTEPPCEIEDDSYQAEKSDSRLKEKIEFDNEVVDLFNITRKFDLRWGVDKKMHRFGVVKKDGNVDFYAYLLSPERAETNIGLFSYGCNVAKFTETWPGLDLIVSSFIYDERHKGKKSSDDVVNASVLWADLEKNRWFKNSFKSAVRQAKSNKSDKNKSSGLKKKKNGTTKKKKCKTNKEIKREKKKERAKQAKKLIKLCKKEQKYSSQLVVRALATLELIIKDPYGDIAVRCKDKSKFLDRDDFVASVKLFEKITMPTYFHLISEENLFKDYAKVKPLVQF